MPFCGLRVGRASSTSITGVTVSPNSTGFKNFPPCSRKATIEPSTLFDKGVAPSAVIDISRRPWASGAPKAVFFAYSAS